MNTTMVDARRGRRLGLVLGVLPHIALLTIITIQAVGAWHSDGRQLASGWLMLEICIVPIALAVGGLCALASDLRPFGVNLIKTTLAGAVATALLALIITDGSA
jgi:hypothetical protein